MNINDVRDFIGKAIKEVANSDATPEEIALTIERAKTTCGLVGQYVQVAKIGLDAVRVYSDTGLLPEGIEVPVQPKPALRAIS